jgi:hypothetical protein
MVNKSVITRHIVILGYELSKTANPPTGVVCLRAVGGA